MLCTSVIKTNAEQAHSKIAPPRIQRFLAFPHRLQNVTGVRMPIAKLVRCVSCHFRAEQDDQQERYAPDEQGHAPGGLTRLFIFAGATARQSINPRPAARQSTIGGPRPSCEPLELVGGWRFRSRRPRLPEPKCRPSVAAAACGAFWSSHS